MHATKNVLSQQPITTQQRQRVKENELIFGHLIQSDILLQVRDEFQLENKICR